MAAATVYACHHGSRTVSICTVGRFLIAKNSDVVSGAGFVFLETLAVAFSHAQLSHPLKTDSDSDCPFQFRIQPSLEKMSKELGYTDMAERPCLLWDLTNNISFGGCWKTSQYQGILPCVLRGHRLWSLGKARPILGIELLAGHGYPISSIVSEGLVNGEMRSIPAAW